MSMFFGGKKNPAKAKPVNKSKLKKAQKKAEADRKKKQFDEMAFWINVYDDDDF